MSKARLIGAWVIAEGVRCTATEIEVTLSSQQNGDKFRAKLAMQHLPSGRDLAYWADTDEIKVEVEIDAGEKKGTLFWGSVDKVEPDFDHQIINVTGRDETKRPVDRRTTEPFHNRRGSEIVQDIAGRNELTADADITDLAGRIFSQNSYAKLTDQHSEWTLVQMLADRDGMVAFTQNGILHFKELDSEQTSGITITYRHPTPASYADGSFIHLKCSRNLQLAKKTKVDVNSWHSRQRRASRGRAELPGGAGENHYVYRYEGLTPGQAQRIADKRLRENTRHERTITLDAPGDPTVKPRMIVNLTGTGTAFDQGYFIDKVTHRVDGKGGYRMNLTSKNTSKKRGGRGGARGRSRSRGRSGGGDRNAP